MDGDKLQKCSSFKVIDEESTLEECAKKTLATYECKKTKGLFIYDVKDKDCRCCTSETIVNSFYFRLFRATRNPVIKDKDEFKVITDSKCYSDDTVG